MQVNIHYEDVFGRFDLFMPHLRTNCTFLAVNNAFLAVFMRFSNTIFYFLVSKIAQHKAHRSLLVHTYASGCISIGVFGGCCWLLWGLLGTRPNLYP